MTRPAASLSIVCAGALLAFAVTARVPGISLHAAGVIVILAGIAVAVLPPSPAADWLRRRLAGGPEAGAGPDAGGAGDDADEYAAYLLQDPAVLAARRHRTRKLRRSPGRRHGPPGGQPGRGRCAAFASIASIARTWRTSSADRLTGATFGGLRAGT
jgi:hypothetical protein